MTLSNQALSSAADKDLELSKQACQEAVNEVIQKNNLSLSTQFTQNLVVHHIKQIKTTIQQLRFVTFFLKNSILNFLNLN